MSYRILHGDCIEQMRTLPDNSVDAVVTDPPAGIAFMGRAWDGDRGGRAQWVSWMTDVMSEALRVLKPGGHALVWALPRTSHWTALALEDAGFEVRDSIQHLFGSGFPKSRSMSEIGMPELGTALKPAHETWWLCRKPLSERTVAANVLRWGTGAINVDGCRIEGESTERHTFKAMSSKGATGGAYGQQGHDYAERDEKFATGSPSGRWPANVLFDEDAAALLDAQSGERKVGVLAPHHVIKARDNISKGREKQREREQTYGGDTGGASRFFYVAKASRRERRGSTHPTVKPVALMRYLVRLITPPGGVVLDPFAGSGTTGEACVLEGFSCILIERELEYIADIRARFAAVQPPLVQVAD